MIKFVFLKTILFFFVCSFCTVLQTRAQTEADSSYIDSLTPQQLYEDSVAFATNYPLWKDSADKEFYSHIDTCNAASLKNASVVKFKSYANVLTQFYIANADRKDFYLLNGKREVIYSFTIMPNDSFYYLTKIPLNDSYSIQGVNACGEKVIVGTFNTLTDATLDQGLSLSQPLFEKLAQFSVNAKEHLADELYASVKTWNDIPTYERAAFVQSYFLHGDLLDDATDNIKTAGRPSINDSLVIHFPSDSLIHVHTNSFACNCMIITTEAVGTVSDGHIVKPEHTVYPDYSPSPIPNTGTNNGKFHSAYSREGAARYEQVYLYHTEGHSGYAPVPNITAVKDSAMQPYYSRLGFTYLCTNSSTYPTTACGCSKKVQYNYNYNTRIWTSLEPNLHPAGHPAAPDSRGGYAEGEDYALLVKSDFNGNFNILKGGRFGFEQSYSHSYNGNFFKTALSVAKSIASAIANPTDTSAYEDLLTGIGGFFADSNQLMKTTGTSGSYWSPDQAIISGQDSFTLSAGQSVYLTLYSFGSVYTSAWNYMNTSAKTVSAYNLGAHIYCGQPDNQVSSCYTNGLANWLTGGFDDYEPGQEEDLNNFYTTLGYPNYPYSEAGPQIFHCGEPYYDADIQPAKFNINDSASNILPVKVEVINILGQKIYTGTFDRIPSTNILNSRMQGIASGVYIMRIYSNESELITSTKFYHM